VIEEDGFNTIIFSSKQSIKSFFKEVKKDGFKPDKIIMNCQVICNGEEAFVYAKKIKLTVNVYTKNFNSENFNLFIAEASEKAFC